MHADPNTFLGDNAHAVFTPAMTPLQQIRQRIVCHYLYTLHFKNAAFYHSSAEASTYIIDNCLLLPRHIGILMSPLNTLQRIAEMPVSSLKVDEILIWVFVSHQNSLSELAKIPLSKYLNMQALNVTEYLRTVSISHEVYVCVFNLNYLFEVCRRKENIYLLAYWYQQAS